jgi:hypothetical protein
VPAKFAMRLTGCFELVVNVSPSWPTLVMELIPIYLVQRESSLSAVPTGQAQTHMRFVG